MVIPLVQLNLGIVLSLMSLFSTASATNVLVKLYTGDFFLLELSSYTTTDTILTSLEEFAGDSKDNLQLSMNGVAIQKNEIFSTYDGQELEVQYVMNASSGDDELIPKKSYSGYRMYEIFPNESEKGDIHYILKSMAQKSLPSLWAHKSQLESAGKRIDHLHPLRFLEYVFSEDELKVYISNVKKRGSWVWSEFIKGLKTTFQEEADIGNMKDEFLSEFVSTVGIEFSIVASNIKAQRWEEFIKTLIVNVPRKGDPARYDQ